MEKGGAKTVIAAATHAVLSGPAIERIQNSVIDTVVLLDTIALPPEKQIDKFKVLTVGPGSFPRRSSVSMMISPFPSCFV